jgi:hypothetical protein
MARVSGVPYEVTLPSVDDTIATLNQENTYLHARTKRLEDELRVANELIIKQNIENLNLNNQIRLMKEGDTPCQAG